MYALRRRKGQGDLRKTRKSAEPLTQAEIAVAKEIAQIYVLEDRYQRVS